MVYPLRQKFMPSRLTGEQRGNAGANQLDGPHEFGVGQGGIVHPEHRLVDTARSLAVTQNRVGYRFGIAYQAAKLSISTCVLRLI